MRSIDISKIFATANNSSSPCCGSNSRWGDQGRIPPSAITTSTTTTALVGLIECVVILNYGESLYGYNPTNNMHIPLGQFSPGGGDIANTLNKLWFYNGTMFYEYNIQLAPFYSVFGRTINAPLPINNLYVGLHAIDNTHLITSDTSTTPNRIVTLDISGDTAVEVKSFNLPDGKYVSGDIVLTKDNKLLVTTDGQGNSYLYQYDYTTEVMEVAVDLGDTEIYPYGLFMWDESLCLISGPGIVSIIDYNFPYDRTRIHDSGLLITGASQYNNCFRRSLIPKP